MRNFRPDCKLYLPCNENVANTVVNDISPANVNCIAKFNTDTMSVAVGKVNRAFNFDQAAKDKISLSSNVTLTDGYTLAFHFKGFVQVPLDDLHIFKNSSDGINVNTARIVFGPDVFMIHDSTGDNDVYALSDFPNDSNWHSFVYTSSGTTQRLFVDNNPKIPLVNNINGGGFVFDTIGAFSDSDITETWEGELDLIAVWDRALDSIYDFPEFNEVRAYGDGYEILSTIPIAAQHYKQMVR